MKSWLSPFVTLLFNKSLASGCFPQDFKNAVVKPRLKKDGLDSQMKKLQTSFEFVIYLQASGESCTTSITGISEQQQLDAGDSVRLSSVS